jgi:hypothetical protein
MASLLHLQSHMKLIKLVVREGFFILWLQVLMAGNSYQARAAAPQLPNQSEILAKSQLSYQAEGGFTNVKSYSVLITCVDGKISTLKSMHNPAGKHREPIRISGTMSSRDYLELWKSASRQGVLSLQDAPAPRAERLDQFTIHFEASAGSSKNKFKVFACSRPEVSRYYSLRNLLDQAVNMQSLWNAQENLARN